MKYDWEVVSSFTRRFSGGQTVKLNPEWYGYAYLTQEYGNVFPRRIESVIPSENGDIVRLKFGKQSLTFASQTLSPGR